MILQVPCPRKLQIQPPFKMAATNHCSPSRTFWGTCHFCLPFERVACKTHQSSPMHVLGPGRRRNTMNINELHGGLLAECSIGMYQIFYQNVSNTMQVAEIPVSPSTQVCGHASEFCRLKRNTAPSTRPSTACHQRDHGTGVTVIDCGVERPKPRNNLSKRGFQLQ